MQRNLAVLATMSLGGCAALAIVGIVVLEIAGRQFPQSLSGLAGTCIGALATLLAKIESSDMVVRNGHATATTIRGPNP